MMLLNRRNAVVLLFALVLPILAACGGAAPQAAQGTAAPAAPVRETVVVVATPTPGAAGATDATAEPAAGATAAAEGEASSAFTTPHPILGDARVRQAIAYCTNRPELIASVYPYATPEQQQQLLMNTNLPQDHWAAAGPDDGITVYPFDAAQGAALLEEAGWNLPEGDTIRTNADGERISIGFTTTNAQFRQTWSAVFIQQMAGCGIEVIPTYAPGSYWFGDTTGLARREFELGAFAWVGEPDPDVSTLYACNQIPVPDNGWEGQNYMGWCNQAASDAVVAAGNTLDRDRRIELYRTFQQEFTKDMVSLPVFQRLEAEAWSTNLEGPDSDATDYITRNVGSWTRTDGGDSVVLGFSQEPASLWTVVENAAVAIQAVDFLGFRSYTTQEYEYQPVALTQMPTIENGGATLEEVEVNEGDTVWSSTAGEAVELAPGVSIVNSEGEIVEYEGGPVTMNKLSVTFEYVDGLTWEDGEPVKQADFELAARINCDPDNGSTSFLVCESREGVDFTSDTSYTVNYLPGALWAEYSIYTVGAGQGNQEAYPSHQVLSDGRTLADVPAAEWATLPEIAEDPLSSGPYKLVEWQKGQRMIFEANENYFGGAPAIPNATIEIVEDTNQAVAQLLTGNIDVLEKATLGAGPEVQTVLDAQSRGEVNAELGSSPTWEHIDFNLFVE